jgi:NADPH:quinone reductase-like Zn-dependent oxidoreductase
MKAAWFDRYGPPEVLAVREVPAPAPGPREVVVRQAASNVSPADCAMRSADPFIIRFFSGLLRPKTNVPGETIAGTVEAVGREVTRFKAGDRVFGITEMAMGAMAERVAIPEDNAIVLMPEALSFEQAGGLPYSFLTAMPFLRDEAKLQPGQQILINGAAGSVGLTAIQLARHMGAEITAVCSAGKADLVRSLGAQHVIDRHHEDFTKARAAYDVIFDAIGKSGFKACLAALKPGGIYLTTVPTFAILATMLGPKRRDGKRGKLATTGLRPATDKAKDMALLAQMVTDGVVDGVVDRRFPLSGIAEAHRYVETGTKAGDVIIEIG